jgi:hypothetical protein
LFHYRRHKGAQNCDDDAAAAAVFRYQGGLRVAQQKVELGEGEGERKCGGMKVTRRACHRGSRSDAIGKIGSIETAGAEDVLHLWRSDTHECFAEMQMQKMMRKKGIRHAFVRAQSGEMWLFPYRKKEIPAVVHQQMCKAGYPPYARLIAE